MLIGVQPAAGGQTICRDRLLAGEGIAVDLATGFMADALLEGRAVPVLPGWHRPAWKLTVAATAVQEPFSSELDSYTANARHLLQATLPGFTNHR